jgi:hypothetical protein
MVNREFLLDLIFISYGLENSIKPAQEEIGFQEANGGAKSFSCFLMLTAGWPDKDWFSRDLGLYADKYSFLILEILPLESLFVISFSFP